MSIAVQLTPLRLQEILFQSSNVYCVTAHLLDGDDYNEGALIHTPHTTAIMTLAYHVEINFHRERNVLNISLNIL